MNEKPYGIIPNVREEFESSSLKKMNRPNPYWQAYLNERDAVFISGYDAAMDVVDSGLLDIKDMNAIFSLIGFNMNDVDMNTVKEVKLLSEYDHNDIMKMNLPTQLVKAFQEVWYTKMEGYRDVMVSGFIDAMPEEEYKAIKEKVEKKEYMNEVMKREEK